MRAGILSHEDGRDLGLEQYIRGGCGMITWKRREQTHDSGQRCISTANGKAKEKSCRSRHKGRSSRPLSRRRSTRRRPTEGYCSYPAGRKEELSSSEPKAKHDAELRDLSTARPKRNRADQGVRRRPTEAYCSYAAGRKEELSSSEPKAKHDAELRDLSTARPKRNRADQGVRRRPTEAYCSYAAGRKEEQRRRAARFIDGLQTAKELPQPHPPALLGLLKVKPEP